MRDEEYIEMMMKNKGYGTMKMGQKVFYWDKIDPKKFHKIISFLKSGIRIAGCVFGVFLRFDVGFFLFGVAEILGIIEEIKE